MQLQVPSPRPPKHVLLVDPSATSRRSLVVPFQQCGYRVTEVENGDEALSRFEQEPASVVVAELSLPIVDGIELVRRIRSRSLGRESTIVAVTTGPDTSPRIDEARSAGCDLILTKPYLPWFVVARVEDLQRRSDDLQRRSREAQERAERIGIRAAQARGRARDVVASTQQRLQSQTVVLANRIRTEFLHMPGLRLDTDYVAQFFGTDGIRTELALRYLVRVGFLHCSDGVFHRR